MRPVRGAAEWDGLLLRQPLPHVLQCHDWGELKAAWGWSVQRFAWGQPGHEVACAQVLVRRAAHLPLTIGYLPRGPLVADREDRGLWLAVLADLEAWARAHRLAVLKMDPDVPATDTALTAEWRRRGWRPAAEQIQFPNTMVSDLSGGEAALLAAMKPKARYNVRLAERRGVKIQWGGADELDEFYRLYAATAARTGFAIRARAYYVDAWTRFLASDRAVVILAWRLGEPLAGVIPVAFGPTTWYLYGASADTGREHMPAYLAQWASLQWAVARGCRRYDWWGGPTRLAESDTLWGVYRFKEGFGAQWVEQTGAWDFAPVPVLFRAYGLLTRARHAALAVGRAR